MSFFDFGTEQTGTFDANTGGDFPPIPKGTVVKVIAEEAAWKVFEPNPEFIEIKWTITEGEYKNRKIFQKIRTQDSDPAKAKKAMLMLGAIDHNCGGKLRNCTAKPTDQELTNALTFKPMYLKLDVWTIKEDQQGNKLPESEWKHGNWVSSVSSTAGAQQASQAAPVDAEKDDLPF